MPFISTETEKEHYKWKSNEIIIIAGEKFTFPIYVERPGSELKYYFETRENDIDFHIELECDDGTKEDIIPLSRKQSNVQPEEGRIKIEKSGKLIITWDNSFSWFNDKTVVYTLELELPLPTKNDLSAKTKAIIAKIEDKKVELEKIKSGINVNESQISVVNESMDKLQQTIEKYMKELEEKKNEKNKILKDIEDDKNKYDYELNELEKIRFISLFEILGNDILSYLHSNDILRLGVVCRSILPYTRDLELWKYIFDNEDPNMLKTSLYSPWLYQLYSQSDHDQTIVPNIWKTNNTETPNTEINNNTNVIKDIKQEQEQELVQNVEEEVPPVQSQQQQPIEPVEQQPVQQVEVIQPIQQIEVIQPVQEVIQPVEQSEEPSNPILTTAEINELMQQQQQQQQQQQYSQQYEQQYQQQQQVDEQYQYQDQQYQQPQIEQQQYQEEQYQQPQYQQPQTTDEEYIPIADGRIGETGWYKTKAGLVSYLYYGNDIRQVLVDNILPQELNDLIELARSKDYLIACPGTEQGESGYYLNRNGIISKWDVVDESWMKVQI